jgi:hypothetical protein
MKKKRRPSPSVEVYTSEKFRSVPLKDLKVRYISQVNDMWGSHESTTHRVNDMYLTFGSFNDIDLVIVIRE